MPDLYGNAAYTLMRKEKGWRRNKSETPTKKHDNASDFYGYALNISGNASDLYGNASDLLVYSCMWKERVERILLLKTEVCADMLDHFLCFWNIDTVAFQISEFVS